MLRIITCLTLLLSASAWADLTIEGTTTPGMSGGIDRFKMYLKDEQLRVDQVTTRQIDGKDVDTVPNSVLVRFTGEPAGVLFLDHDDRTVKVVATLDGSGAENDAKHGAITPGSVSVTRADETLNILGREAQRYDFSFNGTIDPTALVGYQLPPNLSEYLQVNLAVTGSSWVVPGMEGAQELADFVEKMVENELTIGAVDSSHQDNRNLSLISPELSAGLKQVMAQVSRHGLPVKTVTVANVSAALEGQMAIFMQGMLEEIGIGGTYPSESVATRVTAAAIDESMFYNGDVPEGYTVSYLD